MGAAAGKRTNLWASGRCGKCKKYSSRRRSYGYPVSDDICFSTENWKRPAFEVNFLMHLFKNYLIGQLRELITDNVQVHIIGDTMELPSSLQEEIKVCERILQIMTGLS